MATVSDLANTHPHELVRERDRAVLRASRDARGALAARLGAPPPVDDDPVASVERELLTTFARDELRYATCPSCNVRNPEGVAAARSERTVSRWGTAGFFLAVGATSFWIPWVAFIVPVMSMVFSVSAIVLSRKNSQPVPWLPVMGSAVVLATAFAVPVIFPRAAFLVPLVLGLAIFVRGGKSSNERFERAARRIQFHRTPYRESVRL
jgi:hypothetical protein